MTKGIVLSFALLSITSLGGYAQKIAVNKGQKLETVTSTKMSMEVMGQNIENESTITSNVEVKDVNADGYLFANTTKRLVMKINAMGNSIDFDSDKKEDMDGEIGKNLKDQIGGTQEIQVGKNGKVVNTKSSDEKKAAGGMTDMMSMGTETIIKGQPYPILIQLPSTTVKPGDTWTDSSGTAASLKTVTTYTFKGIVADGAQVSFTGTMAKTGAVEQQGMEIQISLTGAIKGEAVYETGSGLLKSSATSTDIKGTMNVMGQDAPLTGTLVANVVAKKI